jgi:hypothetical protein
MTIKTKKNKKHETFDLENQSTGFLVPIYNVHENFFEDGCEPQQVYMTVIAPKKIKGPHLHKIRTGCFTCIKGNARFVLKVNGEFKEYLSGEDYDYQSVIVPTNVGAVLQNLNDDDAYILNMPSPAWTPDMHDEYDDDFQDFDFNYFK